MAVRTTPSVKGKMQKKETKPAPVGETIMPVEFEYAPKDVPEAIMNLLAPLTPEEKTSAIAVVLTSVKEEKKFVLQELEMKTKDMNEDFNHFRAILEKL